MFRVYRTYSYRQTYEKFLHVFDVGIWVDNEPLTGIAAIEIHRTANKQDKPLNFFCRGMRAAGSGPLIAKLLFSSLENIILHVKKKI